MPVTVRVSVWPSCAATGVTEPDVPLGVMFTPLACHWNVSTVPSSHAPMVGAKRTPTFGVPLNVGVGVDTSGSLAATGAVAALVLARVV